MVEQRHLRRKTWMEQACDRTTWRLACALALVVKPFAQRIWPLAAPAQVTLALMARGYSWDAAISELIALPDVHAPESLGRRVDIAEDHWGGLRYTAVARTPQDTRPTLETLAETQATSPLARAGGIDVRYRRLIEDDPACELVIALADLATAPSLPTMKSVLAATDDTSTEWLPAPADSLSVASLIDDDAKRHAEAIVYGALQPATQPLPASARQRRRQAQQTQQAPVPPVIVPVLTPTATTTTTTHATTPTTTHEREETAITC